MVCLRARTRHGSLALILLLGPTAMSRSVLLSLLALLGLTLAGGLLRTRGLDHLLPAHVEPDAHIVVQVDLMERGAEAPEHDPNYGKYPHLVAWATRALTTAEAWDLGREASVEEHLARATAPYLRVRWTVALLSLLAIPVTYLLGRVFLTRPAALLAASAAVTSLLALWFAAQARPHGAVMAFPALAVLGCLALHRRRDAVGYALAGAGCALAVASLQSGVATLLPLAFTHILVSRDAWRRGKRAALHAQLPLLLPIGLVALAIVGGYPFLFAGHSADAGEVELKGTTVHQAGHLIFLDLFNGRGFVTMLWELWSHDPALFVGGLLGIGAALVRRLRRGGSASRASRFELWIVLAYAVPYFAVIGLYQRSYERFLLPLLPFLAVLSAYGLSAIVEWARAASRSPAQPLARGRLAGASLLVALWIGYPALAAVRLTNARVAPSTHERAAAWVAEEDVPRTRSVLLTPATCLPLFHDTTDLPGRMQMHLRASLWPYYQLRTFGGDSPEPKVELAWMDLRTKADRKRAQQRPAAYLDSLRAELIVLEVYVGGRNHPLLESLRVALLARGERLARFSPDRDPDRSDQPIGYQVETIPERIHRSWRILQAESEGPVIEVYRWPGGR